MNDMRNLYQDVILDHNKNPRNFGKIESPTCDAHGNNPLCGDDYHVWAKVDSDGVIEALSFEGSGCAISKAAASMMTSRLKGKTVDEANHLVEAFRHLMTNTLEAGDRELLGHLKVFEGVNRLPQRVKCAVLPWHTLHAALEGDEQASTEGENDEWAQEAP
jgi:nitrogen fixation NifU-like protein